MGLFWIFGGNGEPQGGGRDFLASVHSLDEAGAYLADHPQKWADVFVWREAHLEIELSFVEGEETAQKKRKNKPNA